MVIIDGDDMRSEPQPIEWPGRWSVPDLGLESLCPTHGSWARNALESALDQAVQADPDATRSPGEAPPTRSRSQT